MGLTARPQCPSASNGPSVAILLCTKQGAPYLSEQLDSVIQQTFASWSVFASDDHSDDETPAILGDYRDRVGESRFTVLAGPQRGYVTNFLSLVCTPTIQADYYAFADQDDIWEPSKLARAVEWLQTVPEEVPGLYCGRTRMVDQGNVEIGLSPLFTKPPSFANALIQNIAGGNTMVFNQAARNLVKLAGKTSSVVMHDWWLYQLVTGCGGQVFYDPEPLLRYRQHERNIVGAQNSILSRAKRAVRIASGRFKDWNDINTAALQDVSQLLTDESKRQLRFFCEARKSGLVTRLVGLWRSGIYRQTWIGNLGLIFGAAFNRI